MSAPAPLYAAVCEVADTQSDGTCLHPVWMPYHQPVFPPLDLADGFLVSSAILVAWAVGVKAKLVFRAARQGYR